MNSAKVSKLKTHGEIDMTKMIPIYYPYICEINEK